MHSPFMSLKCKIKQLSVCCTFHIFSPEISANSEDDIFRTLSVLYATAMHNGDMSKGLWIQLLNVESFNVESLNVELFIVESLNAESFNVESFNSENHIKPNF
jgi:hypothetical protein